MTEINQDTPGIQPTSPAEKTGKTGSFSRGAPGEFSKILAEELEGSSLGDLGAGDDFGLPELSATYNAQLAEISRDNSFVPQLLSDAIDMLEKYAGILSDPGQTLKNAYGLLEEIQMQTAQIDRGLTETTDSDNRLKNILDHLATVVELEKIKINRGDYT
ncbi:MAG TPA: hypothetical protein DHV36_23765 [Desulfobacteraceae bacterium]|nr:hypothetical protein [Desulfobacteraceae bacterium]|tara:strand:- start:517 stop:996 length:480 start_codon:yes stop_codon:yes gene_type:complete